MNEDEYDDELPSISVHSVENISSEWIMPSAEELASQRAREEHCERELQRLREEGNVGGSPLATARSDSSGSEGETALAAAVRALQVQQQSDSSPDAAQFLEALISRLTDYDTRLLEQYLDVLQHHDQSHINRVTSDVLGGICSVLWHDENIWDDAEVLVVGCWLCAATCSYTGRSAVRALHALLDERASAVHVQNLSSVVYSAGCPRLLLELSDRAQSGAGRGADGFARALLRHVLRTLAPQHGTEWDSCPELTLVEVSARVCGVWRELTAAQQDVAVRAAGRALALCFQDRDRDENRDARERLLTTLTQPQKVQDRHRPEHLKVRVGVAKLQLLFRDK